MKTTLELPGDLLRRTKAEAASAGQSMKDLVTEALEEKLKSRRRLTGGGWRAVFGRASRAAVREVDKRLGDLERVRVATRHELPSAVVGEYRYGLARSRHRRTLLPLLEELVRESIVLGVGLATAQAYATIRERLRRKGRPIPENDVWISALAVEHGLAVVSRDQHFDEVEGLRRLGW